MHPTLTGPLLPVYALRTHPSSCEWVGNVRDTAETPARVYTTTPDGDDLILPSLAVAVGHLESLTDVADFVVVGLVYAHQFPGDGGWRLAVPQYASGREQIVEESLTP